MTTSTKELNEYTLEDLTSFTLPNGATCFVSNLSNICDIVESLGFSMYYVMGQVGHDEPLSANSTTTKVVYEPEILKVVSSFVSRSVAVVSASEIGLPTLKPQATYNLPFIPYEMVCKLDTFFRLVDTKYGTESIVLLTFDP